jgi:hypothetical protein
LGNPKFSTLTKWLTAAADRFTSNTFTQVLKGNLIQISMDGKEIVIDNIFAAAAAVESIWKSVKYESDG